MFINITYRFLLDFIWGLLRFPSFPLVVALSLLLGFTTSGYPCYKLFFQSILDMCSINALWKFGRHYFRMRQNRSTFPEYLINFFNGVRVSRSLVLSVCFVDRCLSFCTFSFGHCVVCPYSIYRF